LLIGAAPCAFRHGRIHTLTGIKGFIGTRAGRAVSARRVGQNRDAQTLHIGSASKRGNFSQQALNFSTELPLNLNTEVPDRRDPARRAVPANAATREQNEHGSHHEQQSDARLQRC
jgi:hypothetical protein